MLLSFTVSWLSVSEKESEQVNQSELPHSKVVRRRSKLLVLLWTNSWRSVSFRYRRFITTV